MTKRKPLITNTDYSIYKPEVPILSDEEEINILNEDYSKYKPEVPILSDEEEINILNTNKPTIPQQEFSTFGKLNQPFGGYDKTNNTQPFKKEPISVNTFTNTNVKTNTNTEPDLYQETLDNDLKNLKEYQIANGLITGANIASNVPAFFKKSLVEPISAPILKSPKLQSNVTAEMNQMDSAMGQYYSTIRNMGEIGIDDPNVMLAGSANALNAELEQRGRIMQEENNRLSEQSKMDTETSNKQAEINMNVNLQNKQMQYEDNMRRSAEKENARKNIIDAASQYEASRLQTADKKQQEKILFKTLEGMTQQQRSNYFMSQLYNTTGQETVKDKNYKQNDDYNDYLTWKQQNNK